MCPSKPSEEDYFLNVLLLTDKGSQALPQVKLLSNDAGKVAVSVGGGAGGVAEVTFAKGDKPAASLKITKGSDVLFNGALPSQIILEEGRPQ